MGRQIKLSPLLLCLTSVWMTTSSVGSGWSEVDSLGKINGPLGRISGGGSGDGSEGDLFVESVEDLSHLSDMEVRVSSEDQFGGKCRVEKINGSVGTTVKCNGVANLTNTIQHISKVKVKISTLEFTNSTIPSLNLTQFDASIFPSLEHLSVTFSQLSTISGSIPSTLKYFNLSHNLLKTVPSTIFLTEEHSPTLTPNLLKIPTKTNSGETPSVESSESGELSSIEESESVVELFQEDFSESVGLSLVEIDLSHNKIAELPQSLFHLGRIHSIRLSGNHLKCEFVWEKLWEWKKFLTKKEVLVDASTTFCSVDEDVRLFQYSVEDVLNARKKTDEVCESVDPSICGNCSLYALQSVHREVRNHNHAKRNKGHPLSTSGGGKISISIKLDCSSRNLTELPPIPHQTWQLNVSNNRIRDLSPLKLEMYTNLLILDGDNNQVNLETLAGTEFLQKYNFLSLQNNGFTSIPSHILTSFKTMRGQGVTFFGGNFIHCDCSSVKEIKPLLIENSRRIKDMKDIYCKDFTNRDTPNFVRVKDLQYSDVCHMDTSDPNLTSELSLYLIILLEAILILVIIGKVWHDQRTFRRTGILPWCSAKMPRLPCDAMLESVKEPPSLHAHSNISNVNISKFSGSGASPSSNVNVNVNVSLSPRPSSTKAQGQTQTQVQLQVHSTDQSGGGFGRRGSTSNSERSLGSNSNISTYPSRTSSV